MSYLLCHAIIFQKLLVSSCCTHIRVCVHASYSYSTNAIREIKFFIFASFRILVLQIMSALLEKYYKFLVKNWRTNQLVFYMNFYFPLLINKIVVLCLEHAAMSYLFFKFCLFPHNKAFWIYVYDYWNFLKVICSY